MPKIGRILSPIDATSLAVGIVIGTGIFAVPGSIARELGSPGPILLAWALGGLVALAGALTYAEVATMYPRQGGGFVFVLEAFGPWAAFFKGWGSFLVGFPASSAAIATILAVYFVRAAGGSESAVKPVAVGACVAVWALNLRGTKFSGRMQTAITAAKVAAILLLAGVAFAFAGDDGGAGARLGGGAGGTASAAAWPGLGAFAAAFLGVLWTFDGWQNLAVVAGEVERPERTIAPALLATIALVTFVYLVMNVAYLAALPMEELKASSAPAALVLQRAVGPWGARLVAALVVLSAFGSLFGIAISAARYFYALGASGLFFASAAAIDPATQAPRWGQTALLVLSIAYVLSGSFERIMAYYVGVSLIYNMLSAAAVYRLRAKRPDHPRPFRVPGYPVTPAVMIAAGLWITGNELMRSPAPSVAGLVLLAASWPAYRLWRARRPAVSRGAP